MNAPCATNPLSPLRAHLPDLSQKLLQHGGGSGRSGPPEIPVILRGQGLVWSAWAAQQLRAPSGDRATGGRAAGAGHAASA